MEVAVLEKVAVLREVTVEQDEDMVLAWVQSRAGVVRLKGRCGRTHDACPGSSGSRRLAQAERKHITLVLASMKTL